MEKLHIAYGSAYLDWRLGQGHPTNPERAAIATDLIELSLGENLVEIIKPEFQKHDLEYLLDTHDADYVNGVFDGYSYEWSGKNAKLGETAGVMFAGTARLAEKIVSGEVRIGFNPQGAKHHAHYDRSGGFCVFNDMAWAAKFFAAHGLRAMYVDWDAHHGDGVEELLFDTDIVTASIHDLTIFPGTGRDGHYLDNAAYNWGLQRGSGDEEFAQAMSEISDIADEYKPDIVLLATGADAHETDPLSTLNFTYDGYANAASVIAGIVNKHCAGRVLIGGAGGYQPLTHTPQVWAQVVTDVFRQTR